MQQMTTELQQQIEWRKSQVLELSSRGYTEREIATTLQVHCTTVHRDLVYLRKQAHENLQHHIHQTIPEEYQKGMVGLRQNLKHVLEIAETSSDPRVKLEARRIANDCYRFIMDLVTNSSIIADSIKYVQGKMDHLNAAEKKLLQDIKDKGEKEEDAENAEDIGRSENSERELEEQQQEQPTHNGIF
jgi:IS30 family transposase